MRRLHAIVSGRVQMVMFRDFSQRKARTLGIVGTVENRADGSVEIFAEGERDALETYAAKLKRGPFLARVDAVRIEWQEPTNEFTDFTIIY
jgi:acylphosphatase